MPAENCEEERSEFHLGRALKEPWLQTTIPLLNAHRRSKTTMEDEHLAAEQQLSAW
jgi:hypothetical protein